MTYEFYKENVGKLTKEERARFSLLGAKLRLEEQQEELRQAGIAAYVAKANILRKGDIAGLLYDKVKELEKTIMLKDEQLKMKNEIIAHYKEKEPWRVAGY